MRRIAAATLALLASACGGAADAQRDASQPASSASNASTSPAASTSTTCAPAGWVAREMVSELGAGDLPPGSTAEARVLAWRIKDDERPLYVEEALVGVEVHPLSGSARWLVVHVFRHPRSPYAAEQAWRLAQIADTGVTGALRFDTAPPSAAEIEVLLVRGAWADGLVGFKELSGGVCREAWATH